MSYDRLIEALACYIETDKFGTVTYYNHLGDRHRDEGPAVELPTDKMHFLYGKLMSEADHLKAVTNKQIKK